MTPGWTNSSTSQTQLPTWESYLRILPNREKIISRSSSVVTGLSLQTNSTLSSGFMSASGKSPT